MSHVSLVETNRRPIKARGSKWAASIAGWLARRGIRPNTISVWSAIFAALGGTAFAFTPHVGPAPAMGLFVVAAMGVQLRLLCNLFDGMVAVEGGFRTKSGEVFNELPDRFADAFILVGCGYAAGEISGGVALGWLASVLAVTTAYVRALGASVGLGQCFFGPMAKPHRMAVVTLAALTAAAVSFTGGSPWVLFGALVVIVAGTLLTIARRTVWLVRGLESR